MASRALFLITLCCVVAGIVNGEKGTPEDFKCMEACEQSADMENVEEPTTEAEWDATCEKVAGYVKCVESCGDIGKATADLTVSMLELDKHCPDHMKDSGLALKASFVTAFFMVIVALL